MFTHTLITSICFGQLAYLVCYFFPVVTKRMDFFQGMIHNVRGMCFNFTLCLVNFHHLSASVERRQLRKLRPDTKEEELWEELCVTTLADLQERQMMLFNTVQESIFTKVQWLANTALVTFAPCMVVVAHTWCCVVDRLLKASFKLICNAFHKLPLMGARFCCDVSFSDCF